MLTASTIRFFCLCKMITPLFMLLALLPLAFTHEIKDAGAGCNNSSDNQIECCAGFDEQILFWDVELKACADLKLDWSTGEIELDLTVNDIVLFDTEFGVDHAPELCADLFGFNICLALTNLDLSDWEFKGCVAIVLNDEKEIDLGCWDLGKDDDSN